MKVTVLGGAAANPNTGQGCSGFLIDDGETTLVLDLGPGTLLELRRHTDYRTLSAVVLSHLHVDHVLDLVALCFALLHNPVKPPGLVPLWLPPGGLAFLDLLSKAFAGEDKASAFFPSVFHCQEYDPMDSLTFKRFTLRFAPTVHYIPCWAMLVERDGEPGLFYSADTGPAANLALFARGARVVIAEATYLGPSDEPFASRGHLSATEAGELAASAGAETLILAHFWEEVGGEELRRHAATVFDGRLELARPGLTISW
ncbi:MAG: MBL fold metallo-hydrolase [Chloroflexia bacterium]|jgi:ribonuclease BN (tRNA processing enzyme)|nr:MBL fold metallo-hydrolase [Chloroflexia bacterium]